MRVIFGTAYIILAKETHRHGHHRALRTPCPDPEPSKCPVRRRQRNPPWKTAAVDSFLRETKPSVVTNEATMTSFGSSLAAVIVKARQLKLVKIAWCSIKWVFEIMVCECGMIPYCHDVVVAVHRVIVAVSFVLGRSFGREENSKLAVSPPIRSIP